jgi:hypothetical protein
MSNFSLKSFTEGNALVYIAPFVTIISLFHIFDMNPAQHKLGQMELFGVFILLGYYLWTQLDEVYDITKLGKKRIEAIVCIVVGIFSALTLMAPLLTWQYVAFYRASNTRSYLKPVTIAILTLWAATAIFFYGTAKFTMDKMNASATGIQESSMPTVMSTTPPAQ